MSLLLISVFFVSLIHHLLVHCLPAHHLLSYISLSSTSLPLISCSILSLPITSCPFSPSPSSPVPCPLLLHHLPALHFLPIPCWDGSANTPKDPSEPPGCLQLPRPLFGSLFPPHCPGAAVAGRDRGRPRARSPGSGGGAEMPYLLISTQIRLVSSGGTPGGGEFREKGRDRPWRAVRPEVRSQARLALLLLGWCRFGGPPALPGCAPVPAVGCPAQLRESPRCSHPGSAVPKSSCPTATHLGNLQRDGTNATQLVFPRPRIPGCKTRPREWAWLGQAGAGQGLGSQAAITIREHWWDWWLSLSDKATKQTLLPGTGRTQILQDSP